MKKLLLLSLLAATAICVFAQKPRVVAFYNLENLFDTINDPEKNDEEFLPQSKRAWNTIKYQKKLSNMDKVLFDLAVEAGKEFPTVIGVCEAENRGVLEDLISQDKLSHANYRICHFDSPDRRGIDCAFLYRPDVFKLEGMKSIKFNMPGRPDFITRDFVTMWGTIEEEPFFFVVTHWPSRLGGKEASAALRNAAAKQCREFADSVRKLNPSTKVMIMGDLNDDATDSSITEVLGAKEKVKDVKDGDMYNPFISLLKAGYGTIAYRDAWGLFDNIILSGNLVNQKANGWHIIKKQGRKFYGNIFVSSYMIQQEGQFKGYPLRTFTGNDFQGGFSDHLPVYILISK
ncbi:MAG: endonuclease/exonuclease/phosphatase family protein [Alistipes sp.]|nr:endonuclease/exonuclease/phosphatase family protein [Candidatus Alistipes equi]